MNMRRKAVRGRLVVYTISYQFFRCDESTESRFRVNYCNGSPTQSEILYLTIREFNRVRFVLR